MADNESLQSAKHYADHCHSNKRYSTQAFLQMYKTKLFQHKLSETHETFGTSDVLTTSIMMTKNGCVTTFLNSDILLTKGYLQI